MKSRAKFSGRIKLKNVLAASCLFALVASWAAGSAFAQCAMCKASVQAAASGNVNPQAAADTFNLAVLVLLIPPVLMFIALFLVLLRYRKSADERGAAGLNTA
jgi:F0F1-type ATP synthase membrane subunit c/vacuolar-type H+-ATPase subunit K